MVPKCSVKYIMVDLIPIKPFNFVSQSVQCSWLGSSSNLGVVASGGGRSNTKNEGSSKRRARACSCFSRARFLQQKQLRDCGVLVT